VAGGPRPRVAWLRRLNNDQLVMPGGHDAVDDDRFPDVRAVDFVDELYPDVDGGLLVRLKDEKKTEISVARDRVKNLKERLGI